MTVGVHGTESVYGEGSAAITREWFLQEFGNWWSQDMSDPESDLRFYLRGKQKGTSDWTGFFGSYAILSAARALLVAGEEAVLLPAASVLGMIGLFAGVGADATGGLDLYDLSTGG
jgi:hypothetical protein